MSTVRIVLTGHGRGNVFIDGVEIKRVVGIRFRAGVKQTNTLTLQLQPSAVEVEGAEADVFQTGVVHGTDPAQEKPAAEDVMDITRRFLR